MSVATIGVDRPLRQRGKFDGLHAPATRSGSIGRSSVGGFFVDHTMGGILPRNVPRCAGFGVIRITAPSDDERQVHALEWRVQRRRGPPPRRSGRLVWDGRDSGGRAAMFLGEFGLAAAAVGGSSTSSVELPNDVR